MTWQTELVPTVRVLVGDFDSTLYTNARLEQVICAAAMYVQQDLSLTTYTISVLDSSMSPDPVVNNDQIFSNLLVLKAACILDIGAFRTAAYQSGISAKFGPASLTVGGGKASAFSELVKSGPCVMYDKLKKEYLFGNGANRKAVLSPFVNNEYYPMNLEGRNGE